MNALIVEENPVIRSLIVELLEELTPCRFMQAYSKEIGIEQLQKNKFDLVILDFHTCYSFLDDILNKIQGRPSIIVFTSYLNKDQLEKHYKIKVIAKPFPLNELIEVLVKNKVDSN